MKRGCTAMGVALGLAWAGTTLAAIPTPVGLDTGLVSGAPGEDPSITVFKGLPYAAAPVGALRWKPPQPAASWQGVRKANQFGPICPQTLSMAVPGREISEDCLNLDVWTGAKVLTDRRPVMVWIHGGGAFGAGSDPLYDGENLARKGVVVVTVNYRIGAMGFLATPDLTKESGHDASSNYGFMDDIAALNWVRKNIAAFGGDPDNVTLFGQSFGAGTQHFLSLSPLAQGLFKRMITQSHARYAKDPVLAQVAMAYQSLQSAEDAGVKLEAMVGAQSLDALRQVPWQTLVADAGEIRGLGRPAIDGWVVPHDYSQTYALGAENKVLVIAGSNQDESGAAPSTAFEALSARYDGKVSNAVPVPLTRLADFQALAHAKFGSLADAFLKLYPASTDRQAFLANNAAVRDGARVSTWLWGRTWSTSAGQPVYLYFWNHAPPGKDHDRTGAYHGSEIPYVFDHLSPLTGPWTDQDRRIADRMSSYWSNFAKTGDPNGVGLPAWPAFDARQKQIMALGDQFGPIGLADPAKVEFWERFYESQPAA